MSRITSTTYCEDPGCRGHTTIHEYPGQRVVMTDDPALPLALVDEEPRVTVTVTRSAGDDRAVTVHIDTTFEPDASDGGPGLRVLINDDEAYVGKAYDFGANHEAKAATLEVPLTQIPYKNEED